MQNPVASEVYTADSVLIGRYFIQNRTQVALEEISPAVLDALVATEDIRFFDHFGIDVKSIGRVLIKTLLLQNESSGGGSTITQQLAKNLFPRKDYLILGMLVNKLRECAIAFRLEQLYSKKAILALYLNTIPFGDNTYGIQTAAQRFFSTSAKNLSTQEAAVLIGTLKANHTYNPRLFPENSIARRNIVIGQMEKYNFLSKEDSDSLQALPIDLKFSPIRVEENVAEYFLTQLKFQLQEWFEKNKKPDGTSYNLMADGLKIYTTIDSRMQHYAEQAVSVQMEILQRQFDDHWRTEKPWDDSPNIIVDAVRRTARYKALKQEGLSEEKIMEELSKPCVTSLFTWDGAIEKEVSALDSIRHHMQFLNAGFVALDPADGKVKAWVGGIDHAFFKYDHVKVSTKRQVGSIFKPIVFATAIEQGISPCELIPAFQKTYTDEEGDVWTPRNSHYDYPVQYSMRGALTYSVNTVSVKLIDRAGVRNTIKLARDMGIESTLPNVPSIALGSSSISLLEMAGAYACIGNNGIASFPYFVNVIRDREGNVLNNFKPEKSGARAISEETAQIVQHMLKSVVQEGTASRLQWKYKIFNDIVGKTGTTQDNADGWFMAISPKLVMGSWVGGEDPRIRFRLTSLGQGANTALPIVAEFMKLLNADRRYSEITRAQFEKLSYKTYRKINCDLYELDEALMAEIEKSVHSRDSVIQADTLATPPQETFLQTLYKRKQRSLLATEESGE